MVGFMVKLLVERTVEATGVPLLPPQQQQSQQQQGPGGQGSKPGIAFAPFRPFLVVLTEILSILDEPRLIRLRVENR